MAEPAIRLHSYDEYLALERATGERYEYIDGHMLAMAGGTPEHAELCVNLGSLFKAALRGRPCKVYSSDLKVCVGEDGLFTYPDLAVVCGKLQRSARDPNAVRNPVVLVEVLSDGTEAYDRGEKFEKYRQIASLREYVLVSHRKPGVELLRWSPDGSWNLRALGPQDTLHLESLEVEIPVAAIYEDVELPPAKPPQRGG